MTTLGQQRNGRRTIGFGTGVLATLLLAGHISFGSATSWAAGGTLCVDEMIAGGTLGKVIVPAGASCELVNLVVDGSLDAEGAGDIFVTESSILGNVRLIGSTGVVSLVGSQIDGSVKIAEADTSLIEILSSSVAGNVTVLDSSVSGAFPDFLRITDTEIGGNLKVAGNEGGVILIGSCVSGGNSVDGNARVLDNFGSIVVSLNCSEISGNVVVAGNEAPGGIVPFDGDVQVTGNTVDLNMAVNDNTAGSQVAVGDNLAEPGQETLFINVIAGNLRCAGNTPDPETEASDPADADPVEEGNEVAGHLDCFD